MSSNAVHVIEVLPIWSADIVPVSSHGSCSERYHRIETQSYHSSGLGVDERCSAESWSIIA